LESNLLELKAKVNSLDVVRRQLRDLKAQYVEAVHQIDTYFNVPKGRFKLREVEGRAGAELIYYEREDTPEPKKSQVLILEIREPSSFKLLFEKFFGKKTVVDKDREIYVHKGTQIHLDTVKRLGTFVEFEREKKDLTKDREILEELMRRLNISRNDLIRGSYSDLGK